MFRALYAHNQEIKIVLHSILYHHTEISEWSKIMMSNVHTLVLWVDNLVAMQRKKAVKVKTFLLYTKILLLSHSSTKITFNRLASFFKTALCISIRNELTSYI